MITQKLFHPCQFLTQRAPRTQDWFCGGFQHRIALGEFLYSLLKAPLGDLSHLQPKVTQHPADRQLKRQSGLLDRFA
ncbi:hypothetical protein [Loktanella sp. SALINAS62]|uniref:hypothetical protein n=1 Tax=Loktanella sp. SALINAS62 TaxID=2706124 RepID=UPI001B8C2345|nr:hypothetical protein [Loktanella sp. SALINAS62]